MALAHPPHIKVLDTNQSVFAAQLTEPWELADFRQVLLELVLVQALMEQTVVPFMEGDAMIVRQASGMDLPMELAVPFGTIELELVRPHHGDCLLLAFSSAL